MDLAETLREIGFRLRVTIRTDRVETPAVDATDQAILDLLEPAPGDQAKAPPPIGGRAAGRGTRDIAAAIGLSPRATRVRLADSPRAEWSANWARDRTIPGGATSRCDERAGPLVDELGDGS